MRICLAHPYVWPEVQRGGERYLDDLARYLTSAGHVVDVVTGGEETNVETVDGATRRRRRRRDVWVGDKLGLTDVDMFGVDAWPCFARRRYDVVQALVPSAAIAARLAGQRTIFSTIGFPTPGHPPQRRRRALVRLAVRTAHVLTAPSEAAAMAFTDVTGRTAEALWPGVWLDRFPLARSDRPTEPVLLYPSDLSVRRKGLDILLAAVAQLLPGYPGMRLLLSGAGDAGWAFRRLSASDRQAVTAATDLAGIADTAELVRRYQTSTVTVLPAKEEAFGMVLIESLACGTPVVGCAGSGMTEIVTDPAIGRLAEFGDVPSLARALDDAITVAGDPATSDRCRTAASAFGWQERIGPLHERLYERVARRPRGRVE
ncbi:MAG: glycosyltransferase family 4 protein [Actinomycetes bacterium]